MSIKGGHQTETPWQDGIMTVNSLVASLLMKQEFCDVTFRVGADGMKVSVYKCHRALLAGRSSVFARMFYGPLPDNKAVVEVKDILPNHFKLMLKFVYLDEVSEIGHDNLIFMYAVAHKYDLVPLRQYCAGHVKNCISMENVGEFLTMRDLYEDAVVAQHCGDFLKTDAWKLFQKDEYYIDLSQKHLVEIWKRDVMSNVGRGLFEFDIYWGAMKWARKECTRRCLLVTHVNLRKVFGEAMSLFCFPRMSLDQFNRIVKPGGLLTWQETTEIILYMANVPNVELPVGRPFPDGSTKSSASDMERVRLSDGRVVNIQRDRLQEAITGKDVRNGRAIPQTQSGFHAWRLNQPPSVPQNGADNPSARRHTINTRGGNR